MLPSLMHAFDRIEDAVASQTKVDIKVAELHAQRMINVVSAAKVPDQAGDKRADWRVNIILLQALSHKMGAMMKQFDSVTARLMLMIQLLPAYQSAHRSQLRVRSAFQGWVKRRLAHEVQLLRMDETMIVLEMASTPAHSKPDLDKLRWNEAQRLLQLCTRADATDVTSMCEVAIQLWKHHKRQRVIPKLWEAQQGANAVAFLAQPPSFQARTDTDHIAIFKFTQQIVIRSQAWRTEAARNKWVQQYASLLSSSQVCSSLEQSLWEAQWAIPELSQKPFVSKHVLSGGGTLGTLFGRLFGRLFKRSGGPKLLVREHTLLKLFKFTNAMGMAKCFELICKELLGARLARVDSWKARKSPDLDSVWDNLFAHFTSDLSCALDERIIKMDDAAFEQAWCTRPHCDIVDGMTRALQRATKQRSLHGACRSVLQWGGGCSTRPELARLKALLSPPAAPTR